MSKEATELDKFRSSVLTAAAAAVMSEMTPEKMQEFAKAIINDALKTLSGDPWGLQHQVKKAAEEMMKEYIKTPSVVEQIRASVTDAVQEAMKGLSKEMQGKLIDISLRALADGINHSKRGY
jgi:hypothetical protein